MLPVTAPQDEVIPPPEVFFVEEPLVGCQGTGGAVGHPLVYLRIGASGFADCGYCDRRYVLAGGASDTRLSDPTAVPGQDNLAPGMLTHLGDAH